MDEALLPSFVPVDFKSLNGFNSFRLRSLSSQDFERGHCHVLSQMTQVGNLTKQQWLFRFEEMREMKGTYFVIVIEDLTTNKLVASGSLFIERKFIRNTSCCGHLEDIVVDKNYRKRNFGAFLIYRLIQIGEKMGCYKLILDCSEDNVHFYEKCGFLKKEQQMVRYTQQPKL